MDEDALKWIETFTYLVYIPVNYVLRKSGQEVHLSPFIT